MIALSDNLPLLRLADGRTITFEPRWIEVAVRQAANHAGHPRWWLAAHVVESVAAYLRSEEVEPVLPAARIEETVRRVLQTIGFPEVARSFALPEPPVTVSLESLAEAAGAGYELAFFCHLDRTLEELLQSPVSHLELRGLAACVKRLRAAKAWRRDCSRLSDEIVAHVRLQARRLGGGKSLHLELT